MWERRPGDIDFLDVRFGVGVQAAADSGVSVQLPDVPVGEELEPVTGRALRDFILEQTRIRGIGKVVDLRSRPGFSVVGENPDELMGFMRAVLCGLAAFHSPEDVKVMVVTRHRSAGTGCCGCRTTSTTRCSTHRGCGALSSVRPPNSKKPSTPSCTARARTLGAQVPAMSASPAAALTQRDEARTSSGAPSLGPHWVIVDDAAGTPEQGGRHRKEGNVRDHRAAHGDSDRHRVGFADDDQKFELVDGALRHRGAFHCVADLLPETTASRFARSLARWSPRLPRCRSTPAARARNS